MKILLIKELFYFRLKSLREKEKTIKSQYVDRAFQETMNGLMKPVWLFESDGYRKPC